MQINFKWWYAIIGYVAYILSFLINTWLSILTQGSFEGETFNLGGLFNVTMFIAGGIICLVLFRIISKNKISRFEFGLHLNTLRKTVIISSALGLLFFVFSELLETYNENLREAGKQFMNGFNIGDNTINDIILILGIGLFAPVVEEILFRGAIFNPIFRSLKAKKRIPHWVALVIGLAVSTFLFVFSHGGGGQDAQLGMLAVLGILAGLGMYLTNSLFGAIIVHAVNNNLVFIYSLYKKFGMESSYSIKLMLVSILCLLLTIPLGQLFGKLLPRLKT